MLLQEKKTPKTRIVFNRNEILWGVDFLSQKHFVQSVLAVMDKPSKITGEQLVPGKEILIAAKCNRSLGLQIAAAFCILQVPYGRSIHKAAHGICIFYRTSAFMGIITLAIYRRVCLHMFKFYVKSSLTVSNRCGWLNISICHQTHHHNQKVISLTCLSTGLLWTIGVLAFCSVPTVTVTSGLCLEMWVCILPVTCI